MSTRLYDIPKGMTLDAMIESTSTVAVDMKAIDGFVSFASTLRSPNHTQAFFFNIYETMEGAAASNNAGNTNAEEDPNENVPDDVVLIEETAGQIAFDYICAGKLLENEDEKENGDAQAQGSTILAADPLVGDKPRDTSAAQSHRLGHTCSGISTHHALPGMTHRPSLPRLKDVTLLRGCFVVEMLICGGRTKLDLIRSSTTLQHGRYADKELEQWHISFYTIVTNVNGSLEAVDCYTNSTRYDMVLEYCSTRVGPHQIRYGATVVLGSIHELDLIRSSTTLQHGRYADKELEQWHISFYTIVTNVNGSLEAVDCYTHSARYDMVLEYCIIVLHPSLTSSGHLRRCSMADTQITSLSSGIRYGARVLLGSIHELDLIRSSTTLQHGRYADNELEQWHISFYTIVTNVNGSLEAVDCYTHSARYDMVLQ
eukprot:scaffold1073_cov113-Skeletonema_dohrnii-CCMP3373.AAC.6